MDATQDLFIRGIGPLLAAVLVGGGAVTVCLLILAPAAAVLAAGLLAAGIAVPLAGAAVARKAARAGAPARGRLAATVTDLLDGAADLHAFGAADAALERADAADAELTRLARRTAAASGLGTGLMSLVSGLTLWAVLLLGVAATGTGALSRVPLAVLTLTALAAFEAVTALPAAAVQLDQARVSAGRIAAVTDAPDPVRAPGRPRALPPGPFGIQLLRRHRAVPAGRAARPGPGQPGPAARPAGRAGRRQRGRQVHPRRGAAAILRPQRRRRPAQRP